MSTGMLTLLWIISLRMQKSGPIIITIASIGKTNLPKITIFWVSGLLCEPNVSNLTPYLLLLMTIKLKILLILLMVLTNCFQVLLQITIRSERLHLLNLMFPPSATSLYPMTWYVTQSSRFPLIKQLAQMTFLAVCRNCDLIPSALFLLVCLIYLLCVPERSYQNVDAMLLKK